MCCGVRAITAHTRATNAVSTRAWNRSLMLSTNTRRGARHRSGISSAPGWAVTLKPGPEVRGSPVLLVLGYPHGLEAAGEGQGVAVVASRGNPVASGGGVPCRGRPLDPASVSHDALPPPGPRVALRPSIHPGPDEITFGHLNAA